MDDQKTPVKLFGNTVECSHQRFGSSLFDGTPTDCCSVCLSPIKSVFNSSDPENVVVKTKCQVF